MYKYSTNFYARVFFFASYYEQNYILPLHSGSNDFLCDQSDLAEQEDHPSQTGVAIKPLCFLEQLPDESISEKEEGGPSYDMQLYYGRD